MYTNVFAIGVLIAIISCLADVSCRERCLGVHNYCSGQFGDMKAICNDGYCYCTGQDYDYNTCLPDAYGCKIIMSADTALGKPQYNNQQPQTIYSCTPGSSSTQYEVHVLSVYEVINRRPPKAGDATVNIVSQGSPNRPIILVLGSYEPVNWILKLPASITISKVILVANYIDESSVSGDLNQVQVVERKGTRNSQWGRGYGSDSGGGDTVGLLKQVHSSFGVVTSFTGTYKADEWSLVLSSAQGSGPGIIGSSAAASSTATATVVYTPTPTPNTPTIHRQKCYSNYCSGGYKMNAVCKDGYCVCTGQGYNYETCLPDAYGCKIVLNAGPALAKPQNNNQQPQTIYSCTPDSSSTQYEVHVLSVYEGSSHTRPPTAGDTHVNIVGRGKSNRPIVLVFGSYEPVNWILNLPANITISKVILVAYYVDESSVSGVEQQVVERKTYQFGWGFGSDSGGGDTVALLKQVHNMFGVVTSFTGTYKANKWTLELSSPHGPGSGIVGSSVAASNTATAVSTPTPTPTIHRQKCYSNYCPGGFKMNAVCRDGYCVCTGQGYNYETCLPDAYGCKIVLDADTALAKPRYNSQQRQSIYSCTPNSSSTQYEVHVLSVYEVINRRPPKAGDAIVNIISQGSSDRPIILVLGSYEPVNWILNLQPGIKISKVILVAYYLDESSVRGDLDQVQAVERKSTLSSQWDSGYGSDSGGGGTVEMLKQVYNRFGVVTSFTGTYKADEWSLVLSSPQEQSSSPCQKYTCLSKAIQKLSKIVKQLREDVETQDERITALELEKNQGSQYQAIAQYSSGVPAHKFLETLLGVFVTTMIVTITHYVW